MILDFKNMYNDIGKELKEFKKLDKPMIIVEDYEVFKDVYPNQFKISFYTQGTHKVYVGSLKVEIVENTLITDDFIFVKEIHEEEI